MPEREPKRVLVVDDEPDLVEIMMLALRTDGFTVVGACDGIEALGRIKTACPDAILLDLNMPRMDGWEVLKRLREMGTPKPVRVVVLTGSDRASAGRDQVLSAGAAAFLAKPCDPDEVVRTIRRVLEQP